jgi:hypothetical protein
MIILFTKLARFKFLKPLVVKTTHLYSFVFERCFSGRSWQNELSQLNGLPVTINSAI